MKVGDVVRSVLDLEEDFSNLGIIVDIKKFPETCPPVCHILWPDGRVLKDWFDELEVIFEQ